MTEAAVSAKLRLALTALGAVAWKMSDRFHASRPDVWYAFEAGCGFIETKIWPNQPTPAQQDILSEVSAVGIQTYVGVYKKADKSFTLTDWVTKEEVRFNDIREAATWLLKQPS